MTELEKRKPVCRSAGAAVTKDVPDNCVVGGIPTKKIKDIENDVEE